jgi:glutamate synthase (NADPH/NADH) large chain
VATQDAELRKRFTGNPDHVVNFFTFLAMDLREIMAELGFKTVNEMVGQADRLEIRDAIEHWKYKNLDLSALLYKEKTDPSVGLYRTEDQDHGLAAQIDWKLLEAAKPALEKQSKVSAEFKVTNVDRSVGTILSNEISKVYKSKGLPKGTVHFKFKGSAGQSFGAFTCSGIKLEVEGEANDYFGKGLSGSELILYPDAKAKFVPSKNIIVGNVCFYGATSGEAYIRGMAGERFCVRNSGATAVVEGVGDHGCEYMTGGIALILGDTGRNFAAGMSGGVAYIYDPKNKFPAKCNMEMVGLDPIEEDDAALLRRLLQNHKEYTKSDIAENILANFSTEINHFVKVMPKDYKAVLAKRKAAKSDKKAELV